MAKKLIIETEVKTDGIDKAAVKLGELKQLSSKISIQYDVDGKPLDVVINKSLNLQQQVKALTAELRKTKAGTDEFKLLSSRLGEAQDGLAKTTAKSKDLFSSLSLLPGPIGQFFGQLQGSIELLKTFSSFTFKDLAFQFGETADDIADIGKNLSGVNGDAIESVGDSAESAGEKVSEFSDQLASNAGEATASAQSNDELQGSISKLGNEIQRTQTTYQGLTEAQNIAANGLDQLEEKYEVETKMMESGMFIRKKGAESFRELSQAEVTAVNSGRALTITTEGLVVAEAEATVATATLGNTIKTVLISTGVLAAIVVIGIIISKLVEFATSTKKSEDATRSFTSALEEQQKVLQNDLEAIDMANKANITRAKIAGESEEEITKKTKEGNANRLAELFRYNGELEAEQDRLKNNTKINNEDREKLSKDINDKLRKNSQDITKQILSNEQFRLDEELRIADKKREGLKKTTEKVTNDNQKANDLLLKLQQENSVNVLNEERKKQDAQLKIDKENEERDIKNLKLSTDKEFLRAQLLEQIRVKYGVKVIELNKKRQEEDNKTFDEDQKKIKEYNDKVFEIMNAADENELSRNKATLERKYTDDVEALQKDTEFQKQSLEEKIRIILALEKAKNQAIQKLDDDEAQKGRDKNIKKLDDELRFLQIRGDALREGTKSFFDNQRAILKTAEKKELADLADRAIKEKLTLEQIEKEKLAIKEKYLKAGKDIANQELQAILQAAQATLGVAQTIASDIGKVAQLEQQVAMEQATKRYIKQNELDKKTITNQEELEKKLLDNKKKFAKEEDDIKKKAFEENKKIQIAQAIIATLQSAVGAFSSLIAIPFVGPVLAPIAAAAALVFGYKQVAAIKKTQYQSSLELSESETATGKPSMANYGRNYEKGGMIGGRRHAEGGTLIEAEKGEAIMTRGSVAMFAPLLSMMNQAGGGASFNSNLTTTRQDNPILNNPSQEQSPLIVKTYVVSQELTTAQEKQGRLKNLSVL
jgi:hypothetical protein